MRKHRIKTQNLILKLKNFWSSKKNRRLVALTVFFFFLFIFYLIILKDLPSPKNLSAKTPYSTSIYDRNENLLYEIYVEKNRSPIKLSHLPEYVKQATLAIEDKEFYNHHGFSTRGILRASYNIIFHRQLQGGSTISQQLVKNALLTQKRTIKRKVKETILTIAVEVIYDKDQILEMYFNQTPYGGTAWGIEAAARHYFNKSSDKLTLAEAALLAGLPASPTTYSPFGAHPELSKKCQEMVLKKMVEVGFISDDEAQAAAAEKLNFATFKNPILAPHFVMYIKEQLVNQLGQELVERGGLRVTTTLDLDIQDFAQSTIASEVANLKKEKVNNGAALVTNPQTGEILAMVGSGDYFDQENEGNFNVTTALRQPGSAIKVINYAVALQNGFTLSSIISDTPIIYRIPGQLPYSPQNYDNRFHGNVSLRTALASSYNVPAVKVLAALGLNRMIAMGKLMGITTWEDPSKYGLSLTLGGGEVRMTDMAVVYGTLANLGKKVSLQSIWQVSDSRGKALWTNPCLDQHSSFSKQATADGQLAGRANGAECQEQVMPSGVAFLLTDVLSDNQARAPAFGSNSILDILGYRVAVKTGTSNNLRDNWTIGYTPSRLAAVWVGNNDNSPMSQVASGITGASPAWHRIMEELLKQHLEVQFSLPDDIVEASICSATGTLDCSACPNPRREYFLKGTVPTKNCEGMFEK